MPRWIFAALGAGTVVFMLGALAYVALPESNESDESSSLPNAFVARQTEGLIPSDGKVTHIVTLNLEPGRYLVSGKVGLHNRDGDLPFTAYCSLIPSEPDGSAGSPGARESDAVDVIIPSYGYGETTHFVTQELTKKGSVELACQALAVPGQHGAFTNYASISAIEVGSITTVYEPSTS